MLLPFFLSERTTGVMDWIVVISVLLLEACLALWLLVRSRTLMDTKNWIIAVFLLALALGARAAVFDYETLDYQNFLAHWVDFFREFGNFKALRYPVGNYNIPYLYFLAFFSLLDISDLFLIKLLSTLTDILLAWGALLLCSLVCDRPGRKLACFFTVLLLPTVFLNSAVWGQCDSMYVAPLLIGIYCALKDRPWTSMILAAVAFGFKLQAVFLLPIYGVFLLTGRIKPKHILAFPATYVALVLPAVCFGRPFWETVTLYFSQTGSIGSGLNYNSPSIFSVFVNIQNKEAAATTAIIFAFVFMLNVLAVAWVKRESLTDSAILALTLLLAIGIPFLLPHMHERYFYGADIVSVVLAFIAPAFFFIPLFVQFASLLGYHAYLKMRYLLLMNYGAAALVVAFALTVLCFLSSLQTPPPKKRRGRPMEISSSAKVKKQKKHS